MRGVVITAIWLGLGFGATQLIADALEKWRTARDISDRCLEENINANSRNSAQ